MTRNLAVLKLGKITQDEIAFSSGLEGFPAGTIDLLTHTGKWLSVACAKEKLTYADSEENPKK